MAIWQFQKHCIIKALQTLSAYFLLCRYPRILVQARSLARVPEGETRAPSQAGVSPVSSRKQKKAKKIRKTKKGIYGHSGIYRYGTDVLCSIGVYKRVMLSFLPDININSIICLSVVDIVSKITGVILFSVRELWNIIVIR